MSQPYVYLKSAHTFIVSVYNESSNRIQISQEENIANEAWGHHENIQASHGEALKVLTIHLEAKAVMMAEPQPLSFTFAANFKPAVLYIEPL